MRLLRGVAYDAAGLTTRVAFAACVAGVAACWGFPGVTSHALAAPASAAHAADAPASAHRGATPAKAPSGPPLTTGAATGTDEAASGSLQGETDPLVSNGLGSPLCKGVLGTGELNASDRRNCETSGFVAAAAPTGNYGIDVHIDTGVLGLSSGGLLSIVQDIVLTPLWMALVWSVHAVIVMLEWCFTIDLLDSSAAGGVGKGLREMQTSLTDPWLALVLAVAAVLALYDGLIRRRVADTVGRALLMASMMAGGMWVMADPTGTVGALGQWANQASLGTMAAAASGTPSGAGGALAHSMDRVFSAAIEAPWCYLEFGDVDWCRDPARLDPRLRAAALRIAAAELSLIGCKLASNPMSACAAGGSRQARSLEHSAELLRSASSNGAIFLALPANGPARNSINEPGSLLRTLCQSSEATSCRGATAAQAEFRTNAGTWPRVGGLLLIVAGVLGMLLLLGFIALRLLAAAIFSLLYLLLAPGMVLAPALGESGRAVFRRWLTQLLGAVVSKLLFAFLLGVVLAVLGILASLQALGWWTQWLLMSAFWWGAYVRRHQALAVAENALGRERRDSPRPLVRRVRDALEPPRRMIEAGRWTKGRFGGSPKTEEGREVRARPGRERAWVPADEQVRRTLRHDERDARARLEAAPATQAALSTRRLQLERLRREHAKAVAAGKTRRAAELQHRARRVERHIETEEQKFHSARRALGAHAGALRRVGSSFSHSHERAQEREQFLDVQAALPPAVAAGRRSTRGNGAERRDYPALAGLAGYGREEYERLAPGERRAVRVEVDRQLALRREPNRAPGGASRNETPPSVGRRERRLYDPRFDSSLHRGTRDAGYPMPAPRPDAPGAPRAEDPPESSVMRDAREVAARRKRQLGTGRR